MYLLVCGAACDLGSLSFWCPVVFLWMLDYILDDEDAATVIGTSGFIVLQLCPKSAPSLLQLRQSFHYALNILQVPLLCVSSCVSVGKKKVNKIVFPDVCGLLL